METTTISLIVPVRAEPELRARLKNLKATLSVDEIIVVDTSMKPNENVDDLCDYLHDPSLRFRGEAMNRGAQRATSSILWFLHLDCVPPMRAEKDIDASLRRGGDGGIFLKRYEPSSPLLRIQAFALNALARRTKRWVVGTNGFFVRKSLFDLEGGFPPWPFLEDLSFLRRIAANYDVRLIDRKITVSSRRYSTCFGLPRILLNAAVLVLFELGVPPDRLHRWYKVGS